MFGDSNSKIGTRELTAILMYLLGIEISDATPTILFKLGKNAGWMLPLISGLVAFTSLLFLLKLLKKFKDKSLMDIVYILTGKYVGFIIGIVLFLMLLFFTAVNSRNYVDIINSIFFIKTPTIVLYIILIGSSLFIASRGFEAIGRTSYITQPYILLVVAIFILLLWKQCRFEYLKPIFGAGIKEVIKGGVTNSSIFGEIILISVIYSQVRGYKEYRFASIVGLGFGITLLVLFSIIYMAVFDYPSAVIVNYLFPTSARLIFVGRFIGNLEAFFLVFWLVASIIRYSVYIYLGAAFLSYTLKLNNVKALLTPYAALALIIGILPENYIQAVEVARRMLLSYSWTFIYSLPIVLFILSNIRKKENKQIE